MIDYEDAILARQEMMEIWEDDPDSPYLGHFKDGEYIVVDESGLERASFNNWMDAYSYCLDHEDCMIYHYGWPADEY